MKKLLLVGVTLATVASLSAWAQGTVSFNNRISSTVNAQITLQGGGLPDGATFSAQLWAGPDAGSLVAIGSPTPFRTGAAAGFWTGATLSIPGVGAGQIAVMQARAWFNGGGTYATYQSAVAAGQLAGESGLFNISLGGDPGGGGLPIVTPNILGNADNGTGLPENMSAFVLVPEPSTIALGVLGLAGLLFLRRRK